MKNNTFSLTAVVAAIIFSACTVWSQELHIYTDLSKSTYLGCLTCSKYSSESVWNAYGQYGSKYNSKSIWNEYGPYGNKYNSQSPWNEYGTSAPVLIDENGRFTGHFTRNKYHSRRTANEFALKVLDHYEYIRENFEKVVDKFD